MKTFAASAVIVVALAAGAGTTLTDIVAANYPSTLALELRSGVMRTHDNSRLR